MTATTALYVAIGMALGSALWTWGYLTGRQVAENRAWQRLLKVIEAHIRKAEEPDGGP